MAQQTVRVSGLRQLNRAFREVDKALAKELRDELRDAAGIVAEDARSRFQSISPSSAAGFKPRARAAGAFVEQSKRRTTGKRPDFGALQMTRALLPALEAKEGEVIDRVEQMLDRVGDRAGF